MPHNRWMLILIAVLFAGFLSAALMGSFHTLRPLLVWAQALRTCFFPEDVTGDGVVNVVDIQKVVSRMGADTFPAGYDQNFDGVVDLADVHRVADAWRSNCDDTTFDLEWGHYGDAILNDGDDGEDAEFRLPEGVDTSSVIDWQASITYLDGWQQQGMWQLSGSQASHCDEIGTWYLISPRINLFDVPKPIKLTFDYDLEAAGLKRAWVDISINGSGWVDLHPGPGQSLPAGKGQQAEVDLSDYAFSIIQLRWGLEISSCACGDPRYCCDCTQFAVKNVEIKGGIGSEDEMGELMPRVYVADTGNHRIQIFEYESDGTSITYKGEFGYYGDGEGEFHLPEDVVVGPDALVYVADTGNHRIQYFDEDGNFQGQFGSHGDAILTQGDSATDARFNSPSGVATSAWHLTTSQENGPEGDYYYLYIADTGNHRVQRFKIEKDGGAAKYDGEWGYYGSQDGKFNSPEGIDVDPIQTPQDIGSGTSGLYCTLENWEAHVYVADTNNHRVQYFKWDDGTFVGKFGEYGDAIPSKGDTTGIEFNKPQDVGVGIRLESLEGMVQTCAARLVDVYVADTGNHRVQYFLLDDQSTDHQYQDEFGYYGDASCQFNSEAGVAVDRVRPMMPQNDVGLEGDVFVADTWNHRCQRWSRPQ